MARTSSHLRTRDRLFFFRAARFDSLAQLNSKWRAESLIRIGLELGFELGRAKGDAGGIRAKFTCLVSFHLDSTRLDSTRLEAAHFAFRISRFPFRAPFMPSLIASLRARFRLGPDSSHSAQDSAQDSPQDSAQDSSLQVATLQDSAPFQSQLGGSFRVRNWIAWERAQCAASDAR